MSANPIDPNSTPKTTGSLEELFRHHLGEAAVPPSPQLWEHIDNSLLVQQNEVYRRRLATTRWVAAASLLLATVAGGGWWAQRAAVPGGAEVAATLRRSAGPAATAPPAAERAAARRWLPAGELATHPANSARAVEPATTAGSSAAQRPANSGLGTSSYATTSVAPASADAAGRVRRPGDGHPEGVSPVAGHRSVAGRLLAGTGAGRAVSAAALRDGTLAAGRNAPLAAREQRVGHRFTAAGLLAAAPAGRMARQQAALAEQAAPGGTSADLTLTSATAAAVEEEGGSRPGRLLRTLAARPGTGRLAGLAGAESLRLRMAQLQLPTPDALALHLAPLPLAEIPSPAAAPKWQLGASYAVASFNPNINFGRPGSPPNFDYNLALGSNSPALSEQAAAEYRGNLRAGLSQRLSLRAMRQLKGSWSLSTGAEFTESYASSATSFIFVGEQVPDFGQPLTGGALHDTHFRYRMASVPVELRYANATRRGWSLYGRLGTVVSALLGVRAEIDGFAEATREYSLTSPGPYRRVLADVRGSAGAQFRPATRNWAISLGPVAQAGVLSLNSDPADGFWGQHRAYSFGLEAGVEFGR